MKKIFVCLAVLFAAVLSASAQYNSISFNSNTSMRLVQIDEGEKSNILFFTYTSIKDEQYLNYNGETAFVRIPGTFKKYKVKEIVGIGDGSDNVNSCIRKAGEELNFAIEFEKFPLDKPFDIIEEEGNEKAFTFTSVIVDMDKKGDLMPTDDFLAYATAPRTGLFYDEGSSMRYWSENGLVMTMHFVTSTEYGKLFKIYLEVANNTGRSVDLITSNITVQAYTSRNDKTVGCKLLSYNDFDTKVVNNLGWRCSPSTPASQLSDQFRWMARDQANSGQTGAAALFGVISLAASTANAQNEVNFQNALNDERDRAVSNYLLSNTLKDGAVYGGFVAVKDVKPDQYKISLKIGKKEYKWTCNYK